MAAQKRGLGRGLGALIPTDNKTENSQPNNNSTLSSVPGIEFAEIFLNQIKFVHGNLSFQSLIRRV